MFGPALLMIMAPAAAAAQDLETLRRATVMVEATGPAGKFKGSGIVLSADGLVATAAHTLRGASRATVRLLSGEIREVVGVLSYQPVIDLAMIRISAGDLVAASLDDADHIAIGQRLFALGCPVGLPVSVADGLLSARADTAGVGLLQISVPISIGFSGGPVATERGTVVGMVMSRLSGPGVTNVNYALPAGYLAAGLAQAAGKKPISLVEAAQAPAGETPNGGLREAAAFEGTAVNGSVEWAFARLEGVEVFSSRPGGNRTELETLVRYDLSQGTDGGLVIERLSETTVRIGPTDLGAERIRTVLHAGMAENRFTEEVELSGPDGDARKYATRLEVAGAGYRYLAGGQPHLGAAPRNILPPHFLDAAIGALATAPRGRFQLTLLDPKDGRLVDATVELNPPGTRKVPVANPGQHCGPDAKTTKREIAVFPGTLTVGLTRQEIWIPIEPPYLPLDPSVRCVRLPNLTR